MGPQPLGVVLGRTGAPSRRPDQPKLRRPGRAALSLVFAAVSPRIVYEDNHLLVLDKPAGMITAQAPAGTISLWDWAREDLKRRYNKPGQVYLGVVSRLDRPVSGLVIFAKTSKAAARLTAAFQRREVDKRYWAVVEGRIQPPSAELQDWLAEDPAHTFGMIAVGEGHPTAKVARLRYRTLAVGPGWSALEIELETGRKHQIRVQLAARGWPILGDERYGSQHTWPHGIALHAVELSVPHPTRGERLTWRSEPPSGWSQLRAFFLEE